MKSDLNGGRHPTITADVDKRGQTSASYASSPSLELMWTTTHLEGTSALTDCGFNDPPKGQEDAVRERLSRYLYGTGGSHQDDDYTNGKYGCDT